MIGIEGCAVIYTDGGCWPNPGRGGWGVLAQFGEDYRELHGGKWQSTNNEMELTSIYEGLNFAVREWKISRFLLFSDSRYAIDCVSVWHKNWQRNGWMTKSHAPVKNKELIVAITALISKHQLTGKFRWVKGHNGDPSNERADQLAYLGGMDQR